MSRWMVEIVIEKLLTDEQLRERFAVDRFQTLADLMFCGVELTPDEVEAFARTDVRLWFQSFLVAGERVH